MEIAKIKVNGAGANIVLRRAIPAGLVGGRITVEYMDPLWDGLTKTVVFRGADTKDIVTDETSIKIPAETVARAGKRLYVGFYGTDADGKRVVPTFWADLGLVMEATDPSGDETTNDSLPVWAQLAERVETLEKNGSGGTGEIGADGGYYTPGISQTDDCTVEISFTASKEGMPAIPGERINLPVGPQGEKGDTGAQGPRGEKGDPGEAGQDGMDAPQDAVCYGEQSLTAKQQAQARQNIGAVSDDETPKVFYITMNTNMTVDKTDAEIETAYQAGKSLVCRFPYDSSGFLQYINCPLSIRLELDGQVVGWVFSMAGLMPGTTNPSAGYFVVAGGKVENFDIKYSTTQDDIPTELPNPYELVFRNSANAVIGTYNGSSSMSVTIPSKTPNPYALTINGTTYDGSTAVNITLEGGSGTDLSKGYTLTDSDLLHAWWVSTSTDTPQDMTNDMFCTRKFETTIVPRITFDSSYTNCANYTFWKDGAVVGEVSYAILKETYTVDFEFDKVSMNFGWGWGVAAKQYNIVLTIPSSDEMAFKKVLVLGDSISADYYGSYTKWVTLLKDDGIFPANTVNDSIHATGFVAKYSGNDDFITRIAAVDNKKSYDLVVVFGGINDYIQHIPMGESGGDKTANFKPAVDYFFDYLVKNFTQARIVVFSPLRTYNVYQNTEGHYQTEYTDYIKNVAKSYCLPVLNLTEESGFCPFVEKFKNMWTLVPSGYTSADGVHPNEEYQKRFLAPMIKKFLQNYVTGYGAMETEGYTNLVSTMEALDSTDPYNGTGYKNGVYISSSAPYEGTDAECVSTGLMPYGTGVATPVYIKGVTIDTSKSHCRIHGFSADKTLTIMAATGSALNTYFTIETLGDQYYRVTPKTAWTDTVQTGGYADYLRFSFIGAGDNLIITIDEPIT